MVRITVYVLICPTVETLQCISDAEVQILHIDCPTDTLINIKNATIGNFEDGVCVDVGGDLCAVEQNAVNTIIRDPCQNKRTCNIKVPLMGDTTIANCLPFVGTSVDTSPTAMYVAHQCYRKCCVSKYSSRFKSMLLLFYRMPYLVSAFIAVSANISKAVNISNMLYLKQDINICNQVNQAKLYQCYLCVN